jgi:FKBP-type peptidyl-prolyl cis-trans isomerase
MKKIGIALLVVLGLASCQKFLEDEAGNAFEANEQDIQNYIMNSKLTFEKSTTGLYYYLHNKNSNGAKPTLGDEVAIHYALYTLKGIKLDSSERLKNKPYAFVYGPQQLIAGLQEGISLMRKGDRATFLMNHTLAFGSQSDPTLPAYSAVRAEVEVMSVRNEEQQIEDYIAAKKLSVTEKTTSGLRFIRTQTTTNDLLKTGDVIKVKYAGKLLSDKQFDAGEIPQLAVGGGRFIKGFEEGISKMRIGEKAILIFPSAIGYGTQGSGNTIPPYAPLLFEIEVNK